MKSKPIVMKHFSTVHTSYIVNFEFTNNITILTGASATGKTASFSVHPLQFRLRHSHMSCERVPNHTPPNDGDPDAGIPVTLPRSRNRTENRSVRCLLPPQSSTAVSAQKIESSNSAGVPHPLRAGCGQMLQTGTKAATPPGLPAAEGSK